MSTCIFKRHLVPRARETIATGFARLLNHFHKNKQPPSDDKDQDLSADLVPSPREADVKGFACI